jgi:suppressor for copper-sensitivity B
MRSTQPFVRLRLWTAILLVLGLLPGWLNAQDVQNLPPPGEETPALPDFNLDIGSPADSSGEPGQFKGRDKDPEITVTWSPLAGSPDTAVIAIHVLLQEGANTYGLEPVEKFKKNTKIVFQEQTGATPVDADFVADHPPKVAPDPNFDNREMRKYFHEVTFLRRYRIETVPPPTLSGMIDLLVCRSGCTPHKLELVAEWSPEPYAGALPAAWQTSDSATATVSAGSSGIEVEKSPPLSIGYALLLAFLGGVIMNVMPCVLPVIAIKVLSFVQQAGESRARIFTLNLTYSVGVIAVFLGLATLATFAQIGLGELFQFDGFNVVMASVVFAMGLSLLGVFEVQLPGSVGAASEHEGLTGAFFTGILATLLATPCIGPFISPVIVWSVTQPTFMIYAVWGTIGLGMAAPYLLIGAFPVLIHRMPRPGMWMVRFKEFSGFVLMATVIFLMNSISPALLIPTLIMLLGMALGLWMVGNLYDHSTPDAHKWKVRVWAALISLPLIGYGVVQHVGPENMEQHVYSHFRAKPETEDLPWQPFTAEKLVELRKSGQPILIDFTADWCLVCKSNEYWALNTKATAEFVKTHNIVCLQADYTDESPEIKAWLKRFNAAGVPLTVIFPPGEKARGIPFDGAFTQSGLLTALEQAWQKSGAPAPAQTTSTEPEAARQ